MDEGMQITVREGASGRLAIINGKTYTLLRLYPKNARGWTGSRTFEFAFDR